MITMVPPKNWQDLQVQVGGILSECGFNVNTEMVIENARGTVEIDVYAKEIVNGRTYSIACECKNWKSNVPQNTIHGFRSVIADLGVNLGIIITTSDFQSGATAAAAFTNIKLLTWEEFQLEFEKQWLKSYFHPTITEELDPLFTYTEPLAPSWFPRLSPEDKDIFMELYHQHQGFGIFMLSLSRWGKYMETNDFVLPLTPDLIEKYSLHKLPDEILDSYGYRDFLIPCLNYGNKIIGEFRKIRDKYYSPTEAPVD